VSGGLLNIEGAVLPWVRTQFTKAEVAGASYGMGFDAQTGWYLRDISDRVDGRTDMGRFDNDGPDGVPNSGDDDGVVDLAVFQFAEPAASCGTDAIWPHRSSLSGWLGAAYTTDDLRPDGRPVFVNQYHIQSAVNCDGRPQNISVIAHETGHAFGLPDLYDASGGLLPAQRRWVLGCWTLMAAGAWGCGDGANWNTAPTPSHMSVQEKMWVGWITPTVAQPGWRRAYTLRPVQTSADALLVPLRNGPEYLLLEYRTNTGYDASLPAGGVLVYHVEQGRPTRISCNGCDRKYPVSLVEADADAALLRTAAEGGNRGVAGDVFTAEGDRAPRHGGRPDPAPGDGAGRHAAAGVGPRLRAHHRARGPADLSPGAARGADGAPAARGNGLAGVDAAARQPGQRLRLPRVAAVRRAVREPQPGGQRRGVAGQQQPAGAQGVAVRRTALGLSRRTVHHPVAGRPGGAHLQPLLVLRLPGLPR
jgi:M6 family metalloprotease-like protein